jgi:hypothetical protein
MAGIRDLRVSSKGTTRKRKPHHTTCTQLMPAFTRTHVGLGLCTVEHDRCAVVRTCRLLLAVEIAQVHFASRSHTACGHSFCGSCCKWRKTPKRANSRVDAQFFILNVTPWNDDLVFSGGCSLGALRFCVTLAAPLDSCMPWSLQLSEIQRNSGAVQCPWIHACVHSCSSSSGGSRASHLLVVHLDAHLSPLLACCGQVQDERRQ